MAKNIIPIYKIERELGLEDRIQASASVLIASALEVVDKFEITSAAAQRLAGEHTKAGETDPDLHYLRSILVSTGWNKNDDVFLPHEVWAARYTPEHKPFNYQHDGADIIGHMISNCVVDNERKLIPDNSAVDDLPAEFHILNASVLYKYWEKAELQERMDEIIKEIAESKWFVSMEALFKNFDYVVGNKVVARNEKTAFLTKHLRAYGGNGVYQDEKVGRVLRAFVFSGVGLVRTPANPKSEFVQGSAKNLVYSFETEIKNMANDIDAKLVDSLKAEVEKLKAELHDGNLKKVQAELKEALELVTALRADIKKLSETNAATVKERDEAVKALEGAAANVKTIAEQLETLKAAKKAADRLNQVKSHMKCEDAEANEICEALAELSDEKFAKALLKFTPAQTPPKSTPAPEAPQATDKVAPAKTTAAENLDKAVANKEPALNGEDPTKSVKELQKTIANFMSCVEPEGDK